MLNIYIAKYSYAQLQKHRLEPYGLVERPDVGMKSATGSIT